MTRIDFYVLEDKAENGRYPFTCRLVEKIYHQGRRVYIHTGSDEETQHLDRLLWTFRQGSFIPHGRLADVDPAITPVIIGNDGNPGDEQDVLINLSAEAPGFFSRFERVAEPIDDTPEVRHAARSRFRYYRDRGYPMETHTIKP